MPTPTLERHYVMAGRFADGPRYCRGSVHRARCRLVRRDADGT